MSSPRRNSSTVSYTHLDNPVSVRLVVRVHCTGYPGRRRFSDYRMLKIWRINCIRQSIVSIVADIVPGNWSSIGLLPVPIVNVKNVIPARKNEWERGKPSSRRLTRRKGYKRLIIGVWRVEMCIRDRGRRGLRVFLPAR